MLPFKTQYFNLRVLEVIILVRTPLANNVIRALLLLRGSVGEFAPLPFQAPSYHLGSLVQGSFRHLQSLQW